MGTEPQCETGAFPHRLHLCLAAAENEGQDDILSWASHGRAFTVHRPEKFVQMLMPRFFGQTKYASFQRQLNIYGFSRFLRGRDKSAYYHLAFVKGEPSLLNSIIRQKVKGTKHQRATVKEYNFYHPAWRNHCEATVPPILLECTGEEDEVKAQPSSSETDAHSVLGCPVFVPTLRNRRPKDTLFRSTKISKNLCRQVTTPSKKTNLSLADLLSYVLDEKDHFVDSTGKPFPPLMNAEDPFEPTPLPPRRL